MIPSPKTRLVAAGSLFFAGWGLLAPRSLARRMGVDETAGRQIGVRETIIGGMLLASPGPMSLSARAIADIADTAQTFRHDRRIALLTSTSAIAAAVLAVSAARRGIAP